MERDRYVLYLKRGIWRTLTLRTSPKRAREWRDGGDIPGGNTVPPLLVAHSFELCGELLRSCVTSPCLVSKG